MIESINRLCGMSVLVVSLAMTDFAAADAGAQPVETGSASRVDSPNKGSSPIPITVTPAVKPNKESEWVVLPIPKSSPAIGTGLQLVGARFFKADTKSQPSVFGAGAGYYSSDTWFAGVGGAYNFAADRWRIMAGVGYVDASYDFYGIGNDAGDATDIKFPIRQTGTAAMVKVLRLIGANWYAGIGYRYLDSQVSLRVSLPQAPELEEILNTGVRIVAQGPTLSAVYDTRDLNLNPRTGSYVSIEGLTSTKSLDSEETYQRLTINASHYWPLSDDYVLAGRMTVCGVTDNAPFFDLCLYGSDNDLRGYTVGRYQDLTMFAAQAELRAQFTPRWGGVVFAGIGEVAPDFGDMNSGDLLPAGGVGVRWMAAPENRVNVRADLAWGQGDDALFYLSIGEAF